MSITERTTSERLIDQMETWSAHNYHPLPVVIAEAEGAWVTDVDGKRYLDMLAAYSALNFGHRHPRLVEAAKRQLDRVTLTSRAFHNDLLGEFCEQLAELCGMEMVLPMNTGAEAVETAVKTARRWGYDVKGVGKDRAKIVVCGGNFHGRTVTIISFSDDPSSYGGFGPYTPGFVRVPYGDIVELLPDGPTGPKLPSGVTFQGGPTWDTVTKEINIIGQRADDACDAVEKFLDVASLASVDRVSAYASSPRNETLRAAAVRAQSDLESRVDGELRRLAKELARSR